MSCSTSPLHLASAQVSAGIQQNVANAIRSFFNSVGTLPPGFNALFGLTGSPLSTALSQLSG
jgi:hypothetical protein